MGQTAKFIILYRGIKAQRQVRIFQLLTPKTAKNREDSRMTAADP